MNYRPTFVWKIISNGNVRRVIQLNYYRHIRLIIVYNYLVFVYRKKAFNTLLTHKNCMGIYICYYIFS